MITLKVTLAVFLSCQVFLTAAFSRLGQPTTFRRPTKTSLNLFDKVFEESGPLGKGVTVGKIQVALACSDRGPDSIVGILERKADSAGDTQYQLARLCNDVCLSLLRKSSDWTAAASESDWFSWNDAGKAESLYNTWANREAAKYEKEYIPGTDQEEKGGGPTLVVVSLVVEIQGDNTDFDGAGYSLTKTKEVLSSLAGDCLVEGGECINAVEVFWCPGEKSEVLTSRDVILDFPELIDL
mmetsp:Transcript_3362/g.4490  ORF Transcript_3362/g.4490 Transcript_3362/m.4490 type:complete len:240 (+) Transcript_3362:41-760(+)